MLNYVVYRLSEWLLCGPLEFTQGTCRTQEIAESAYLPRFLEHPVTLHWGFVLALVAAALTGWFLFKTTWGFELRTVGANPDAARYGGMSVAKNFVLAMFLSGCLAGLAGVVQGLGITHNIALGFQAGYGFDSIALALLGKSHPAGVVAASLLFGVLRAGRGADAVGGRRSDRDRADRPVAGHRLYRRTGHHPGHLSLPRSATRKRQRSPSFPAAGERKGGRHGSSSTSRRQLPRHRASAGKDLLDHAADPAAGRHLSGAGRL